MKGCCQVCNKNPSKYKCPKCLITYCSLGCFKFHKATCEEKFAKQLAEKVEKEELEEGEIADEEGVVKSHTEHEDKVQEYLLEKLGNSKELKEQLENKHLQTMLQEINSDINPGEKLDNAMKIPIFAEFVDTCMGIVAQKGK